MSDVTRREHRHPKGAASRPVETCAQGANDHGQLSQQCRLTCSAGRRGRGRALDPHHHHRRPRARAAARLGGFQGDSEPRLDAVCDLSGARAGAGAHGAWLFRAAAAVSAGRRVCADRPVCCPRPVRIEQPPRARRECRRMGCVQRAALALVRSDARAGHAAARAVRDLGDDSAKRSTSRRSAMPARPAHPISSIAS